MKRKREPSPVSQGKSWDYGEGVNLYLTAEKDIERLLLRRNSKIELAFTTTTKGEIGLPRLLRHKRVTFRIQKDKRAPPSSAASENGTITREIQLFLPDFLNEEVWHRHQFSRDDVISILHACPKSHIWQLGLFYNVQMLNSASKPSWVSPTSLIYGGKSSAITRIMKEFDKEEASMMKGWKARPSALLKCITSNKQPVHLPFHWVSRATLNQLARFLPRSHPAGKQWLGEIIRCYEQYVTWKAHELQLVPLAFYQRVHPHYDFILLNVVTPYEAYCSFYHQNTAETPLCEVVDMVEIGQRPFALLDEAFYVVASNQIPEESPDTSSKSR